jgi:cyanophycinase-like exopeptidase
MVKNPIPQKPVPLRMMRAIRHYRVPISACMLFTALLAGCRSSIGIPPASPAMYVNANGVADAHGCHPIFYKPTGAPKPHMITLHGPGLVLGGGGTDVNGEFVWIHDTIVGSPKRRGGDLVVLRAYGNNDYDRYIYRLAPYHSVRTLLLPKCTSPAILRAAAAIVTASSAVFFAGGDQADYVIWKDTPIRGAVQQVYESGGVVGGTSAGEAVLGEYVFNALHDNRRDATSANAVHHPYERLISFTYDFLHFAPLHDAIADMHFVTRNRFGRTAVFMARQIADGKVRRRPPALLGIGVDERSGIVIDRNGIGTLLLQGKGGSAFLIRGDSANQIVAGKPFISSDLTVTKVSRQGDRFDFNDWCGREPTYHVRVDGRRPDLFIYSPHDPYVPPPSARIPNCRN